MRAASLAPSSVLILRARFSASYRAIGICKASEIGAYGSLLELVNLRGLELRITFLAPCNLFECLFINAPDDDRREAVISRPDPERPSIAAGFYIIHPVTLVEGLPSP